MKTLLTISALALLSLPSARGEETAAAPEIELKNKSSFTMEASGRNPFWPIGWKPVARTQNTTEHVGPDILPSAFVVSSITLDHGARFAIINGKPMQEGQVFGLQVGTQTYQLTVKAIEDGRVVLSMRDREIPVPLRRK
ncbi:MAG: general secretion pathway protein GspB [Verrucomicrobiota bacterium]|nr:general secretion pathway protein GspB [Verrucomicrobiota bacterium]